MELEKERKKLLEENLELEKRYAAASAMLYFDK